MTLLSDCKSRNIELIDERINGRYWNSMLFLREQLIVGQLKPGLGVDGHSEFDRLSTSAIRLARSGATVAFSTNPVVCSIACRCKFRGMVNEFMVRVP